MTKQFTALLVLELVNEGKIEFDARVSEYLPNYRKDTEPASWGRRRAAGRSGDRRSRV